MKKNIDEKIDAIKVQLRQARLRKQRMQAIKLSAETKKQRAQDARKQMLLGEFMMDRMKTNSDYSAKVMAGLDGFLKRSHDRALFGLEPIPAAQAPVPA